MLRRQEQILMCLEGQKECFDYDMTETLGQPRATVSAALSKLVSRGEVVMCHSIRFENDRPIGGVRCRLASHLPTVAPGQRQAGGRKV